MVLFLKQKQTLWFLGVPIERSSNTYQKLLDFIYLNMYIQNEGFKKDLNSTNDAVLQHSIGSNKITDTVLTESEFCRRLTKIRNT